jgi:hypothetical protein
MPSLVDTTTFSTTPSPKPAQVYTSKTPNLSAVAYQQLSGIGPNDDVTKANFLYIRTANAMKFRLTTIDTPANLVSEEWIAGMFLKEFPDDHALIKVEAIGSGQFELVASGNQ